ncbi:MAG TPA: hypothetical protein VGM29_00820 [Polyangiaceae bacterium]|jgi:hypothetical protein
MRARRELSARAGRACALALLFIAEAASFGAPGLGHDVRRAAAETTSSAASDELVARAALECFSDGVSCVHSAECCSLACVKGQCGQRSKLKRRLARTSVTRAAM